MHERTHWLDQPRNVKRLWRAFLGVLALTVLAEVVVPLHPHFVVETIFGFSAWFGFLACAAIEAPRYLLRRRGAR